MDSVRGIFIAIEGTDGSGKGTQCKLLADRLMSEGYEVATFDFPRYDEPSSYFVREYLNGKYGSANEVGPYTSSLFYALDRYAAAEQIRAALAEGKVVLANRFTGSSMAHQGTKFAHIEERRGFFIWLDNLEFEMLHIPRPSLSIVLRVPAETAQQLVDQKETRSYTDKKRDIHEADLGHMQRSVEVYDDLCQLFPKDFMRIDCVRGGQLMSIEAVQALLWQKIEPQLPAKPAKAASSQAASANSATASIAAPVDEPTPDEEKTSDDSKAENDNDKGEDKQTAQKQLLPPVETAATEANAPEQKLAATVPQPEALAPQTAPAAPVPHVQRLGNLHVVIDNASDLLVQRLAQHRLVTYIEQPAPRARRDQANKKASYAYVVPDTLPDDLQKEYRSHLDQMLALYDEITAGLQHFIKEQAALSADARLAEHAAAQARRLAQALLPVGATATVGILANGQALEQAALRMLADTLPEARTAGRQLLANARKALPHLAARAETQASDDTIAETYRQAEAQLKRLADELLPDQYAGTTDPVTLTEIWPRNELDLVAHVLFTQSNLPLGKLQTLTSKWPYSQKAHILETYVSMLAETNHLPGQALASARYSWDILSDYGVFRALQQRHAGETIDFVCQTLTPRYGYEMPQIIEDAGLDEQFEHCFALSLKLHSMLQEAGFAAEAQYATLRGHRVRWQLEVDGRGLFALCKAAETDASTNYAGCAELLDAMQQKLAEAHPLLAAALSGSEESTS